VGTAPSLREGVGDGWSSQAAGDDWLQASAHLDDHRLRMATNDRGYRDDGAIIMKILSGEWQLEHSRTVTSDPPFTIEPHSTIQLASCSSGE